MYILWQVQIETTRGMPNTFEVAEEDEWDAIELCKIWCFEYILPTPTEQELINVHTSRIGTSETRGIKKEPWTCKILEN